MTRPVRAVIDCQALHANLLRVRAAAPGARVLAVVKADGYGHGMLRVAGALRDADAFGVAAIDEALALREAGIAHPIVLLEGFFSAAELREVARHRCSIVVHHEHQLALLEGVDLGRRVAVWLKVDTGMHRVGFPPAAVAAAYRRLAACVNVAPNIRLMTHLANADERRDPKTDEQIECFAAAGAGLEGERSIANSAGILGWPRSRGDWVRPGIMLYGASPFNDTVGREEGLAPVMTLTSELIAVNRFRRGDAIGYGGTWTCPEDMPVGVVAIGYGDGYPRSAPSGTPVLLNGRRVPIIGRVSMDMLCVDLRGEPRAHIGDAVELWGRGLPVEEIARRASTIAYELLCRVTRRVRYVGVPERSGT